jgi:cobalt-zinc-cadmium efflux system membrane fusion protein
MKICLQPFTFNCTESRQPVSLSHCKARQFFEIVTSVFALVVFGHSSLAVAAVTNSQPKPLGCLIEPDRVADVGTQVVGIVQQVDVKRGETVAAGQQLLTLRADVERANASAAQTRAGVDADVLAAKAGVDLADQKLRRANALVVQNFVSDQAVELARGELEVAKQKFNQVRGQQRIWVEENRVAQAQLALRTVRSPFAGVVVERYVNSGERVEDRPLMRVAVIDPLRVELMVPTAQYGSLSPGDTVTIQPELPGAAAVKATVRHVDRVLDAASNSFRVQLTLPNPNYRLPAGLRCKADLMAVPAAFVPAGQLKLAPMLTMPRAAPVQRTPL